MTRNLAAGAGRTLLLGICLFVAGCGGASSAATATPVATTSVDLPPSYLFQPAVIQVHAGDTVTWTNHDNFTHSVQVQGASSGVDANVHLMHPGDTAQITFTAPGTYNYVCTFHTQNMKGVVIVS
jgi:plastocyanin